MRRPSTPTPAPAPRPARGRARRSIAGALAAVLLVLVGVTGAGPALGDSLSDQRAAAERKAAQNEQDRSDAEAALEGLSASLAQTVLDLQTVEERLPVAQQELTAAEDSLAGYQREAAIIAARLQDAETQQASIGTQIQTDASRADEIRSQVGQLAREAYRGGPNLSGLSVLLGATSTEDFAQQYNLAATAQRAQSQLLDSLTEIEATNRNSQARLSAVGDRITQLKADADAKVTAADKARQEAADRKAEVEQLIAEQQAKKASIEDQKAAAQAEVAQLDAEAASLQSELAAIAAQEQAAAAAAAAAAGKAAPSTSGPPPAGALFGNPTSINPIHVTSEYGMRLHPILGYYRLHAGIDLRTYCNTPIYAARAGTVEWAKLRSGFGNQVMVNHGLINGTSVMTSYNHMTSFVVKAGQAVSQGTLLGYSGNTGTSAACHLHFEVYFNGATVNPRPLLGL